MLLTIIWAVWFCILMLLTIPFLMVLYLLRVLAGKRVSEKYAHFVTKIWGKLTVLSTGSKVFVSGLENIPEDKRICFVSNHQSLFDIPLLLGWLNRGVGFIAKMELKKVPIINGWIISIHSAFIDRSNPRKAIESIKAGTETINNGHALVIFPEGTRSKDCSVSDFKTGSLKLATNASAIIIPVTISGTRKIYEANGRIQKSQLNLLINKPVYPTDDIYLEKIHLAERLNQIIKDSLKGLKDKDEVC